MNTLYDLLEVGEDASKEEIEKSYARLVLEFRQDIKFDALTNKKNENIVKNLRIAYEILVDDEKRKKYDRKLAQLRAEELESNTNKNQKINEEDKKNENILENERINEKVNENEEDSKKLSIEEKESIKKNAEKEFDKNIKIVEEYVKSYNNAYTKYKINESIKKTTEIIIVIFVFILILYILFLIPPTRRIFINLYEENEVIKIFVDIIKNVINSILKRK